LASDRTRQRVLVVEDDIFVQGLLSSVLENEGFATARAGSAREALAEIDHRSVSAILLDLGLPDEEGVALLRKLRQRCTAPVIVVTASEDLDERLAALELGAGDFVIKPVEPRELILRLKRLIVPSAQTEDSQIEAGGWCLDLACRVLKDPGGATIDLRRAEFNLLAVLFRSPGRIYTRGQLLDAISTQSDAPTERTVDVLVSRIRKKLRQDSHDLIVTVTGVGYTLRVPEP
jgi:DNA-binding response OmpR family regulator